MFPIAIIAGVIGAVVSTAQGASWASDHLGSAKAAAAGGKVAATSQPDAKTSASFEAALTAQVTGQSVPASTATTSTAASSVTSTQQYGTDYDSLARTNAGITAYGRAGEHQTGTAKPTSDTTSNNPVTKS
jgi:hypothetical protein